MVIDTSAIVALIMVEEEADRILCAIVSDPVRLIGAATMVEAAAIIHDRKGLAGEIVLEALLHRLGVQIVPFAGDPARLSRIGFARFELGLGDCLTYGLAMATGEPLLYAGPELAQTDVVTVRY
jgi:ribonuclease VapC